MCFIAQSNESTKERHSIKQFSKWKDANLAWQNAYIFEFGPAETNDLRNQIGNFPAYIDPIDEAISSGTFDINTPDYAFARGFAAMDYILFGLNVTDLNADATLVENEMPARTRV